MIALAWVYNFSHPEDKGLCYIFDSVGPHFEPFNIILKSNESPFHWDKFIGKTIHSDGKTTREIIAEIDAIEDKAKPDPKYMPASPSQKKARDFLRKTKATPKFL